MGKSAKIEFDGKSYTFPVITGSENEEAIDINQLRSETGLITYDPGYKNTGHCISEITYLDGENGVLRYRGYSVDELCQKKSFLEVVYLLIYGDLPTKSEIQKFQEDIREEALVDEDLKQIFKSFPKSAHPMGVLSSLTSALIAFNPLNETKISLKDAAGTTEKDKMYLSISEPSFLINSSISITAWLAPPCNLPQRAEIPADIDAYKPAYDDPTILTVDVEQFCS